MRVVHWNISKPSHPMYALKKYEDELFENMVSMEAGITLDRIQRAENKILGNTVFSWPLQYRCRNADIVHATFQAVAPAVYFHRPKKFVVTVHDLAPLVYPSEVHDLSVRFQWLLTPKALRKADKIIAISEFTKKEMIRLLDIEEEKISVVYQGVNHSIYHPMDKEKCKKKFGLNPDNRYILVVSSNVKHKRMDLTRKIFEEIRSIRDDIKLIKIGYGEELQGEHIINPGWVPEEDMPALYNAADVYLHTSEYEGFGLPVLEAMACGVPVIANNKASIPEVTGDYKGLMNLERVNVAEIARKILASIDVGIDKDAVKRGKQFSWRRTASETSQIYASL